MACETESERTAIFEAEKVRIQNMTEAESIADMRETHKALQEGNEELQWHVRLKKMKKHYNWTDETIAEMAGYKNVNSFRNSTQKTFPGLLKLGIQIFEKEQIAKT